MPRMTIRREIVRPSRLKLMLRRQRRMVRPLALSLVSFAVVLAGMVVVQANERPVATPQDFAAAVADARRAGRPAVFLLVNIGQGRNVGIALKLDEPKAK